MSLPLHSNKQNGWKLDLRNNLISAIHPSAFDTGTALPSLLKLQNNRLTCLPGGLFAHFTYSFIIVWLDGNLLSTAHPDVFFSTWSDPPTFARHRFYFGTNPVQCSTICWLKHSGLDPADLGVDHCADGIDWDSWDRLNNGQCVIPPAPSCPLPSPIPGAHSQGELQANPRTHKKNMNQFPAQNI